MTTIDLWGRTSRVPDDKELRDAAFAKVLYYSVPGSELGLLSDTKAREAVSIEFEPEPRVVGYPLEGRGYRGDAFALAVRAFTAKVTPPGGRTTAVHGYARFGTYDDGQFRLDVILASTPRATPRFEDYARLYLKDVDVDRRAPTLKTRRARRPRRPMSVQQLQEAVRRGEATRAELLARIAEDLKPQGIELREGLDTLASRDERGLYIQIGYLVPDGEILDVLRHEHTHAQWNDFDNALAAFFGPWGARVAECKADVMAGVKAGIQGRPPTGLIEFLGRAPAGPIHGTPQERIARAQAGAVAGLMLAPFAAYLAHFDV